MSKINKLVGKTGERFDEIAALALVALMSLGVIEVVMRFFSKPVPGAFEISGFLGVLVASLALARTAMAKGHIAVTFLTEKMPSRQQVKLEGSIALVVGIFCLMVARQSFLYALQIFTAKEVSMTIAMPIYPFVLGFAAGILLLAVVLLMQAAQSYRRLLRR